tara:strand:- start:2142 stop:2651 length:510 start_codon:yes stop_codon:yes gene_type:complete
MIISCNECNRKFEIDSKFIPESGRLLECSVCNNQWFYKNEISNNASKITKNSNLDNVNNYKLFDQDSGISTVKKKSNKNEIKTKDIVNKINKAVNKDHEIAPIKSKKKENKSIGILNLTIIFIISFIAFIILIDTFKYPISKIVPNIEFILYNLYETITDILLFFKDLI